MLITRRLRLNRKAFSSCCRQWASESFFMSLKGRRSLTSYLSLSLRFGAAEDVWHSDPVCQGQTDYLPRRSCDTSAEDHVTTMLNLPLRKYSSDKEPILFWAAWFSFLWAARLTEGYFPFGFVCVCLPLCVRKAADVHYCVKVNGFHSVVATQTAALGFNGRKVLWKQFSAGSSYWIVVALCTLWIVTVLEHARLLCSSSHCWFEVFSNVSALEGWGLEAPVCYCTGMT